jgi:(p)ppGpp synthase/HD superfamily hydrolase
MEKILEAIREYADRSHGEQMRKYTPERYIVHPVRVMNTCREYTDDITMLAAALLHDVLEDTPVTTEEMLDFLKTQMSPQQAQRTLDLVIELTDVYVKSAFPKLNRRQRKGKELERLTVSSPDSQTIKYADIMDNCSEIVQYDRDFARVFLSECRATLLKLDKGNPDLYKRALDRVEQGLKELKQSRKNKA